MTTNDELAVRIRQELGNPDPHEPGDEMILQRIQFEAQDMQNRLSMLGAGWGQGNVKRTLNPLVDVYPLTEVPNMGKVTRVHVSDVSSPTVYTRYYKVPVIQRQEIGNYIEATGSLEIPSGVLYYVNNGVHTLEFIPKPTRTLYASIWFEEGAVNSGKQDNVAGLAEFHHLLCLKAAFALLQHCEWSRFRIDNEAIPPVDREKLYFAKVESQKKGLGASLMAQIAAQDRRLDQYAAKSSVGGTESSELFGMDYLQSYF